MTRTRQIFRFTHASWSKERLFFSLLFLLLLGIAGATYVLFKIASGLTKHYNPYFGLLIKGGVIGFFLIVGSSIFLLGINLFTGIELPFNDKIKKITISFFFPLTVSVGKILRISKEQIQESFLEVINKLIRAKTYRIYPQKILLLLPHCLQNSRCPIRLTPQGSNCQRCGECGIKDLCEIADGYGVKLTIVAGGELARTFIKDIKPEAVVAVACTKEMISGIQDTYPLLVLSVLNQRPNGPCIDTRVNLGRVEEAIRFFLGDKGAGQTHSVLS